MYISYWGQWIALGATFEYYSKTMSLLGTAVRRDEQV